MPQLSDHFTLEEATFSSTAARLGVDNQPNDEVLMNLIEAAECLERVREFLKHPIHIDSWFRGKRLNEAVGGIGHSAHMDGWAIDFICPGFGTPDEIAKAIAESGIKFDQCIAEGAWCHISFAPTMRHQLLTAHFTPGQPTRYTVGV